ncbi:MAG: hypothetical protein LAO51_10145 [Acidobacteriia bacterium]|nr:hypothetical protein [Terriglobia bacterium]
MTESDDTQRLHATKFIDDEVDDFLRLLQRQDDLVPETIRFHLITESQIDRLLSRVLPRGRNLLKKARLGYFQKVHLLESLGFTDDATLLVLRVLNKVRNACAHDRHRTITREDVWSIGEPLGDQFNALQKEHGDSVNTLALHVFAAVFGRLSLAVYRVEHPNPPKGGSRASLGVL